MIIQVLFATSIILLIAHLFAHYTFKNKKYKKQNNEWNFEKEAMQISSGTIETDFDKTYDTNTEITLPVSKPKQVTERDFLDHGKLIANEQKIKIMNHRLDNLERALTQLIKKNVSENDIDFEKIDFKIKVLEKAIDDLKNPKENKKTFYGKTHDPFEKEIKALAFNSKKNN